MYKVTAIIPNYNHSRYLEQRIESVLSQTYEHLEIILLDDCSTDNSAAILQKYSNNPKVVAVIINETNSGSAFKQWKKGIDLAQGDFIWIAESDDWCEPTLVENLVEGIQQNENVIISFCGTALIRNNTIAFRSNLTHLKETFRGEDFISRHMLGDNTILNASMAIFKKETALSLSNTYTTYQYCGDWLFWIELAEKGNVYASGKILNYFRKHDQDVSGKSFYNGVYYSEYLRLTSHLLSSSKIPVSTYKKLLLKKYTKLRLLAKTNIELKNEASKYRKEIGMTDLIQHILFRWRIKAYRIYRALIN